MYIIAPEPISMVYFIHPSHQSVCHYVARQQLSKNITAAEKTDSTIEEKLDVPFSMGSMSHQRKVDN
jgi:hypothetical protein